MDTVRRQDAAAFLHRVADLQDDGLANGSLRDGPKDITFADFDYADAGLHGPEVRWMATNGISEGWEEADGSRTFRGMSEIVRQDMAALIQREYDHVLGVPLSECEAVLYSDGELVFQRAGTGAEAGREVVAIGDWYGQDSDYYWHTDTFRPHRYEVRRVSSRGRVRADEGLEGYFSGCENLTDISGLADWDVSGVTDMSSTFQGCSSLADLSPLSAWDVSGVTDMEGVFSYCYYLKDLSPLSAWDVSGVTNLSSAFYCCFSLKDLSPLSDWDVSGVTDMHRAFWGCILTDLSPLSRWDVSGVTNMSEAFRECRSLADASPLEGWKVGPGANKYSMFYGTRVTSYPSWYRGY